MIAIENLIGIEKDKRDGIIKCLDDLMFYDAEGKTTEIITGYNLYDKLSTTNRIITFSHMHRAKNYRRDMLQDLIRLGYKRKQIEKNIRDKMGCYRWELDFIISPNVRIRNRKTGTYLDLNVYKKALENYREFATSDKDFVAEENGWQLDLPFSNKKELITLVDLFMKKSGKYLCSEEDIIIKESKEEKKLRNPWRGAYKIPVLILGEKALTYRHLFPSFIDVVKISIKENNNEVSFIIHEKLELLKKLQHYKTLIDFGFKEELCLANKLFIKRYVDNKS